MRPSIVWLALGLLLADVASAQTTAALGTSIVFPVAAQTVSFASEMTLFNPGAALVRAKVSFYEASNSEAPGPRHHRTCAYNRASACGDTPAR